ncbi:class I SAM-dependent methyltransferase [Brevibacterium litoralis]|uniref:class I SAM-dependent methyltransferase n=1 Tax=Brevibacterium litoralis TaxID=3138935 RepID=UPI0032EC1398
MDQTDDTREAEPAGAERGWMTGHIGESEGPVNPTDPAPRKGTVQGKGEGASGAAEDLTATPQTQWSAEDEDELFVEIMVEFHKDAARQGPGTDAATLRALNALPRRPAPGTTADGGTAPAPDSGAGPCAVLDLGCGTGAQTLVLARHTEAHVTALDVIPEFLQKVREHAAEAGVAERVTTVQASFDELETQFEPGAFDLVWAEGAIQEMGFREGLEHWKRFVRPGGHLVVTDLCWTTDVRPAFVEDFWAQAYEGIGTVEEKLAVVEQVGLECLDWFELPREGWTTGYYGPIRERTPRFLAAHRDLPGVEEYLMIGLQEAELYERFGDHYGMVFFILEV